MFEIPHHKYLPTHKLASVFNKTTNSYKFYWFSAILNALKKDQNNTLNTSALFREMLNQVWYPLSYYQLSFGKEDGFKSIADYINSNIITDNSPSAPSLMKQIEHGLNLFEQQQLIEKLDNLNRWVPYRFIRPFFYEETARLPDHKVNAAIKRLASASAIDDHAKCPYYFSEGKIHLNEAWKEYFIENMGILQAFIYWHLTNFVQKNNPNTIGISKKLFKPFKRELSKYKNAWNDYLCKNGSIQCIYSSDVLPQNFSLDHFIPWSFVVHDLNWNLVPVKKEINSSKGNSLPDTRYVTHFIKLQYNFFHSIIAIEKHNKVMEEYSLLFNQPIYDIKEMPLYLFEKQFYNVMNPMIQIATNMGFKTHWKYAGS